MLKHDAEAKSFGKDQVALFSRERLAGQGGAGLPVKIELFAGRPLGPIVIAKYCRGAERAREIERLGIGLF